MKKIYNPYLKKSVSRNYIEFINDEITFSVQDVIDVLSGWDGELEKWSLLDIGCGIGNISKHELIKRFKEYVGVEPSKEFFNYANKHNKNNNTEFYNCSVENLPFEDNSFDIIYFCESICYNEYGKVLTEVYRILKPNGTLYIKDLVTKCSKDKLSESELTKLNTFTDSWYTEVFDTETIIDIVDNIGGFELISNKRFIKPSIHWINAVRNSSLKQYHNARTSSIPPVRGADFLYRKIQL